MTFIIKFKNSNNHLSYHSTEQLLYTLPISHQSLISAYYSISADSNKFELCNKVIKLTTTYQNIVYIRYFKRGMKTLNAASIRFTYAI